MSYSPSLSYFLDRLSGYSTNYFKLQAQGSSSATANNIIRFNLPSNALLNMRTFALHFNATTAASPNTAGARLPNKIDSLIERVEVSVGGVQLSAGANYYNVLCHAKQALMGDRSDPVLGHPEIVREKKYVDNDGTLITGTNNETYVATNDSTQFCIDHWEGFLGSCEPKVLDSSLLPDIVVSIYLASNNVLCSVGSVALTNAAGNAGFAGGAGAGGAIYTLNNIHATIECLGLADATYDNMVSQMIAQKGYVEVPFKQYISFRDNTLSAMRFSVAAACLDRIWVAHHMDTHATQGKPVAVTGFKRAGAFVAGAVATAAGDVDTDIGKPSFENFDMNQEKYIAKEFNFKEPPTNSKMRYQFQLNGALYPQFQASFEEMYEISKSSVLGAPQKAYPLSTLKDNYSVQCIRLNMPESEYSRLLSGLDTRGVSLNGFYNLHNANAPRDITLFAECTSVLRIGSGKQLEVIQ